MLLRRELVHAIWLYILDGYFMHAYTCINGLVFRILDGIMSRWRSFRVTGMLSMLSGCIFEMMASCMPILVFKNLDGILLFPRFNTYSADYPEKSVVSILKQEHIWYFFAGWPCLAQCPAMPLPCDALALRCPCSRCLLFKSKIPRLGSYRQIEIPTFGQDIILKSVFAFWKSR